ncbi:MAG: radical SAM protein [Candidatus Omnitrophota bacterium]
MEYWENTESLQGIKKANPRIKIVLGGPEVSPRAEEILVTEKSVDIVAKGEGEVTFSELARNFMGDISGISGISFREGKKVISNPDRARIRDLEDIPSPYLSGVIDLKDKNIVDLPLETARGCAFRCGYCYYHKNFPQVRYFSLARVEKELKLILSSQPKEVYLMDATFNSNPRRAKKILRFFIKYNRNSSLHLELKAELIDEEFARLLRKANCLNIEIGIQSTNSKTLKAVNRQFNRKKFQEGISLLNKHKLFYEIQLIDVLPFQSYAELKKSLDWLYSLRPARVVIFRLAVLPGTALRRDAGRYGIVYDSRTPYYAVKSDAMHKKEVSRAAKICFAMERLYDSHIFQETLYGLKSKGGIRISEIFEDWASWEARFKRRPCDYPFFLNKKSPEFLEYICRKRGKVSLGKELMPGLKETLDGYKKAYYS